ncbi:MAG: serine hydrolase [Cyanobacterium sp. T60_A2020_053]|nr:serine hydrolase [Cyanobacterium sp. T60_A2020_053]
MSNNHSNTERNVTDLNKRRKVVRLKTVNSKNQMESNSLPKSPESLFNTIFNYIFRLGIVGVGIGSIFGTILANIDLTKPLFPTVKIPFLTSEASNSETAEESKITEEVKPPNNTVTATNNNLTPAPLAFSQELMPLREKLLKLTAEYQDLKTSAFFVDLDNGAFVNLNGITPVAAASTIKTPILVAFLQDVDAGKVRLDEMLTMTEATKAPEAGNMQYQPLGTQYTALKVIEEMMINSDNTATNMIIEKVGGAEALNQRFKEWGLEATVINNYLPDMEGTNTTSARDLAQLLMKVNQGDLVSLRSRDRMLNIMERVVTRTLLPQGLEPEAIIYHKTGDIGIILGDAGIIDIPSGKRYIGAVFVQRPYNDVRGRTLIQDISRTTYQHFKWYEPRNN